MGSSYKITLSEDRSQKLVFLSVRLALRPNQICRLAIGRSLAIKPSVKGFLMGDAKGREFARFTITGEFDEEYKVMIFQHEFEAHDKRVSENQYFSVFVRGHIERGIESLHDEYIRMNSPVKFLLGLVDDDGKGISYQEELSVSTTNTK